MKVHAMVSCLLIDRDAGERQKVVSLLWDLGISCIERQEPEEGIRYCTEAMPDVVVMQASQLPAARDFLRLTRRQGRRWGRPVVILYADTADTEIMGGTILDGAAEFLLKPFDRDLLQFKLMQAGVLKQ